VLDDWAPTPKFYDLNNGAFDTIEDIYAPFSIGQTLQVLPAGNVNCWRNQPVDSQETFLASDCTWIQAWVELRTPEKVAAFQNYMDNYASEQKKLGRFERPLNNHLTHPGDWLKANEVVRDDNRVLVGLSFMFLAVCLLNMIGLLLAKFLGAAPVVGLRRALGASKGAIFRQHLVEVGVIGLCGGALGIIIAALGLMGIRKLYEHYDELTRLDFTMVLITLGIAVLSGIIAGLYPTWRVCSIQPAGQLKTQ
jgi:putative ABC transport system permease protein